MKKNPIKKNARAGLTSKKQGFTLVETLVSLFVFSVLVYAIAAVYTNFLDAQRNSISLQRRLESLQMVANFVAKTARTSTLIFPNTPDVGVSTSVILFDHSRDYDSNCIKLEFDAGTNSLKIWTEGAFDVSSCEAYSFSASSPISLTDERHKVYGSFYYRRPETGKYVGFFSVSLQACDGQSFTTCEKTTDNSTKVQSSVSMRLNN